MKLLDDLDQIFDQLSTERVLICGDVNIDVTKENNIKAKYLEKLLSNDTQQLVQTATRLTADSASAIDHIITNMNVVNVHVNYHTISDHQVLLCLWDEYTEKKRVKRLI